MRNKKRMIVLGSLFFIGMCFAAIQTDLVQIVHAKVEDAITGTKAIHFNPEPSNHDSRAAVSSDFKHMAFCKGTKEFFVQDLSTGKITAYPADENIYQVKYSPDNAYLAAGRNVLNTKTGKVTQLKSDAKFSALYDSLAFSPDSSELALVNQEQLEQPRSAMIEVWNIEKEKLVQKLPCGFVAREIAFSPDGCNLAVAGDKIILWDVPKGQPLKIMATGSKPVDYKAESDIHYEAISFSPDGKHLAAVLRSNYDSEKSTSDSSSRTEAIEIWDTEQGAVVKKLELDSLPNVEKLQYSPDGQYLACGSGSGKQDDTSREAVWIWDVDQKKVVKKLSQFPDVCSLKSMSYSTDGSYLSVSGNWNMKIWKIK